jgi:hypothetical protein
MAQPSHLPPCAIRLSRVQIAAWQCHWLQPSRRRMQQQLVASNSARDKLAIVILHPALPYSGSAARLVRLPEIR